MSEERYPQTITMKCKNCGGRAFSIRWEVKSEAHLMHLAFAHDGYGLMVQNSIIKCCGCGTESPYEEEEFLETETSFEE